MQITVQREQLEPCKVALTIHVPPEQVARTRETVFKKLARQVAIPGYRRGKAPLSLVKRWIDEEALREEAVEQLIKNAFRQAIEQEGIQPWGSQFAVSSTQFLEDETFEFKATVPLQPEVELGDYRGIEVRRVEVPITDADIDRELKRMREQAARFEEVQSPVQEGDRINAAVRITVDGEVVEETKGETTWLIVGANFPEFDQGVLGAAPGEERTFTFTYPADMEDAAKAGKTAEATVAVRRVQRRIVPELDDAFARSLGQADLAELRAEVRRQLEEAARRQADDFLERDLLQRVVERAIIRFPEAMVDQEVAATMDRMIADLEERHLKLEDYLQSTGKTLAELEQELAEDARRKIRNSLVLMRIAEENEIRVEEADVAAEIERRARAVNADPAMMRRVIEEREGEMDRLEQRLFFRKTLEFLKSISKITEAV